MCRYQNSVSEWTLDYPPLFAWFEWLVSHAARLVEPAMLEVRSKPYMSDRTLVFQVRAAQALHALQKLHL